MKRAMLSPALFAAVLIPAACNPNLGAGPTIVRCEYGTVCPNVDPPARLDILNTPNVAECDDMGGTYVGTTCVGVDY